MPGQTTSNTSPQDRYKEAGRLLKEKRFAEAERILLDLLEEKPNAVWIMCRLGEAQFQQDNSRGASEQFIRALIINPEFADAHVGLGKITEKFGELEAALDHYRRALALAPERRWLNERIDSLHQNLTQGKKPTAAIADARTGFWKRYKHANALLEKRNFYDAEVIFRELLQSDPNNAPVLNKLGKIARELGHVGTALKYYERSTDADPDNLWGYIGQAEMLGVAGDLESAIKALEAALQRDPSMSAAQDRLKALRSKQQQKLEQARTIGQSAQPF